MINNLDNKLKILEKQGLVSATKANIIAWLKNKEYSDSWKEIENLIENEKVVELNDAFFQVIPFGTGGRRGKMGVGSNRINIHTIATSAQGFSEYLIKYFGKNVVQKRGVVIAYDARHNSRLFAETSAEVFAGNGLKVYFYENIRSTPQLSFSVRSLKAVGGAMISASHNPPSDNGIKVYWSHGGQVVFPHDKNIIDKVNKVKKIKRIIFEKGVKDKRIIIIGEKLDQKYSRTVAKLSLGNYRDVKIIFTPLHCCASTSFLPVLSNVGFKQIKEVKEQMPLDPNFSAVVNQIPNPEVPISLSLATELAKKNNADIVLASDPDADRIGVVSRESLSKSNYIFLNGNQIGVLIFDYIIRELKNKLPKNGIVIKTIVTTDLLTKMAKKNNIHTITDLPVGFKYIGDAMEKLGKKKFLFGAEESHGYLYGNYARDKDGAVAALLICEYSAKLKKQGITLFEQLENIKKEYGYYRELLQSVFYQGMDGMDKMLKIMDALRNNLPLEIAGFEVFSVLDQLNKKVIQPKTKKIISKYFGFVDNALIFYLDDKKNKRVVVRPSGTEPKIKFYVAVGKDVGLDKSLKEYSEIKKEVDAEAFKILEEFVKIADSISKGGQKFEILG